MPRASSPTRALGLLVAATIGLGPNVANAQATPAPTPAPTAIPAPTPIPAPTSSPSPTSSKPAPSPPEDRGADPPLAPISPEAATAKPLGDPRRTGENQPSLVAPANNVTPVSPTAGMGGRLMSTSDPEARRARAELEGTALSSDKAALADIPRRLPPLQRGAWWSMFGAFTLASAGGVFAGLAEVQEDKAERLAITLDTETGKQLPYADIQGEYDGILRVGRRDAGVAKGFLIGGAGFLIAGVTLFIVHAVRARKAESASKSRSAPTSADGAPTPASGASPPAARAPEPHVRAALGGLEVRF